MKLTLSLSLLIATVAVLAPSTPSAVRAQSQYPELNTMQQYNQNLNNWQQQKNDMYQQQEQQRMQNQINQNTRKLNNYGY